MMACESSAVVYRDDVMEETDDIDYNFGSRDLGYPRTLEELKAELHRADAECDDPTKWVTSEQMWAEIHQKFPWANIR